MTCRGFFLCGYIVFHISRWGLCVWCGGRAWCGAGASSAVVAGREKMSVKRKKTLSRLKQLHYFFATWEKFFFSFSHDGGFCEDERRKGKPRRAAKRSCLLPRICALAFRRFDCVQRIYFRRYFFCSMAQTKMQIFFSSVLYKRRETTEEGK